MAVLVVDDSAHGRDPEDHLPTWAVEPGRPLVAGVVAGQRLATGTRCETWLGWMAAGWYPVVVKLPRPHQLSSARAWAALTREVFVLSRCPHPALPRLLADRTDTDRPHVLLEYVEGPTLADALDDHGRVDPRSVIRLGGLLLSALLAVHGTGAAHCDVKPENVLLRNGSPVLIDFGSTRPLGSTQPAGRPLGTPGYAAPEMESCAPIHPSMDVYGVGMIMHEALVGGSGLRAVPPGRRRSLRAEVGRVIQLLLAPDPRDRPDVAAGLVLLDEASGGELAPPWLPRQA